MHVDYNTPWFNPSSILISSVLRHRNPENTYGSGEDQASSGAVYHVYLTGPSRLDKTEPKGSKYATGDIHPLYPEGFGLAETAAEAERGRLD
jgi:hypothetical protein